VQTLRVAPPACRQAALDEIPRELDHGLAASCEETRRTRLRGVVGPAQLRDGCVERFDAELGEDTPREEPRLREEPQGRNVGTRRGGVEIVDERGTVVAEQRACQPRLRDRGENARRRDRSVVTRVRVHRRQRQRTQTEIAFEARFEALAFVRSLREDQAERL